MHIIAHILVDLAQSIFIVFAKCPSVQILKKEWQHMDQINYEWSTVVYCGTFCWQIEIFNMHNDWLDQNIDKYWLI